VAPTEKAEVISAEPRRDPPRHEGRFDEEGASPAHGVDQGEVFIRPFRPTGKAQNGRREIFLEGGLPAPLSVSPPVEAFTGEVDADLGPFPIEMQMDSEIRPFQAHGRPPVETVSEPVRDRVLYLQRRIMGLLDGGSEGGTRNGKGVVGRKMALPVHGESPPVEGLDVRGLPTPDGKEDAPSEP
jgi:hypothetical protein